MMDISLKSWASSVMVRSIFWISWWRDWTSRSAERASPWRVDVINCDGISNEFRKEMGGGGVVRDVQLEKRFGRLGHRQLRLGFLAAMLQV